MRALEKNMHRGYWVVGMGALEPSDRDMQYFLHICG